MRLIAKIGDMWWGLVRFGFRLLYNELAFTYDFVSQIVSLGAWRCWQQAALNYIEINSDGLILELAHGTGNLQIDLQGAGYRTVGYDLSPNMGRIARKKLIRRELHADLVRGKAQELPFASGVFTAIVATFPTEFMFQPTTLKELHRTLKNDGTLVIVPNGVFIGGGAIQGFLEWLYQVTGQRASKYDRGIVDEIASFFASYGFEAKFEKESCRRSVATVIVACKRSSVPNVSLL
jgi:ubiquinone/menaquinone biosynthesis C-methylase UbiE